MRDIFVKKNLPTTTDSFSAGQKNGRIICAGICPCHAAGPSDLAWVSASKTQPLTASPESENTGEKPFSSHCLALGHVHCVDCS